MKRLENKTAIILAGGKGTRLQSVISEIPKPMAPINDTPFLTYLLNQCASGYITQVILAVGYKHKVIQDYYGNEYKGMNILYSIEKSPLGTGGAIKKALKLVTGKIALILNGDSICKFDIPSFWNTHKKSDVIFSILTKRLTDFDRYGTVTSVKEKVTGFKEKRPTTEGLINTGVYLINKLKFEEIEFPEVFSFEKEFMEKYVKQLSFHHHQTKGFFIDIGIPEDYLKAQEFLPVTFN